VLRRSVVRTVVALACISAVVVLGMAGIGFFAWAGYQYLLVLFGPIAAGLLCGLVILFCAGALAWLTNRLVR